MNILLRTSGGRGGKGREYDFVRGRERGRGSGREVETEFVYLRNCIVTLIVRLNKFNKLTNKACRAGLVGGWVVLVCGPRTY